MDLRAERTRQWIIAAFIELVNEEGFQNVTVSQIAENAQINRKTFYAHYLDKYDLAEKIAQDFIEQYQQVIAMRFSDKTINLYQLITSFLSEEDFPLLRALFSIHTEEFDFE